MKIKLFFILFVISLFDSFVFSQCSMCKVVAESAGAEKEGFFEGLNSGIMYLMAIPYILLIIGGLFLYFNRKNRKN
mgnify:CR=1 FL=1